MAVKQAKKAVKAATGPKGGELVILTGLSGSGKLSALKAFEDLGFYSVDNLPLDLVTRFADLIRQSKDGQRAALYSIDVPGRGGDCGRSATPATAAVRH